MIAEAVVATGPGQVGYRKVKIPDPGADDVVIRLVHSWISNGTEGSFIRGERIGGDIPWRDGEPLPFPHVPGYQKVGVVEGVGKDVRDFREGDWVFGTISAVEGMFYATGGHVSPAVTHQSQVWKLPRPVSPLAVSGLVLTQVGCNCGMRPALQSGDRAVVIGDGLVGHWSAQTLAYRGARVMLVGRRQERLSLFETGDEGRRVNSRKDDPLTMAREWAPEGVQVLVDTVGSIAAVEAFYPVLRHDAHIVSAGFYGANGKIDIQAMRLRELTLHTPSGWSKARMDTTLDLIEKGVLKTEPLITHRFRAQDAVEAYSLILFPREPALGIVLDWQE